MSRWLQEPERARMVATHARVPEKAAHAGSGGGLSNARADACVVREGEGGFCCVGLTAPPPTRRNLPEAQLCTARE